MTTPNRTVIVLALSALVLFGGCKKEEPIVFYNAPKDPAPATQIAMGPAMSQQIDPHAGDNSAPAAPPDAAPTGPLQWTIPPDWKSIPAGEMRFAAFSVSENPPVQMTVIPLGPEAGQLLPNVNRWEQQVGLPPSPADKLDSVVKKTSVNGLDIASVDLTSPAGAEKQLRMLAAMTPAAGQVWFFKLAGPADVVAKQKDNFDHFIASIAPAPGSSPNAAMPTTGTPKADAIKDGAPLPAGHPPLSGQAPSPGAAPLPAGHPPLGDQSAAPQFGTKASPGSLKVSAHKEPADWHEVPGSKLPRVIAFTIAEGDAKADLIVTRFAANNAGSFLDNINRWRAQIALPPVPDAKNVPMTDVTAGKDNPGVMLKIDNPDTRKKMDVAVISAGPDLFFFKLVGPADTVEKQRPAFDAFLKSLEFAPEADAPK